MIITVKILRGRRQDKINILSHFCRGFHTSEVFFFSWCWRPCPSHQRNTMNNQHWEFYKQHLSAMPTIVKILGPGTVVGGWSVFFYHCECDNYHIIIFLRNKSQRFCYTFNVWKRGEQLVRFGGLNHLEKCSNKFLQGQHCRGSGFVRLDVFNEFDG